MIMLYEILIKFLDTPVLTIVVFILVMGVLSRVLKLIKIILKLFK